MCGNRITYTISFKEENLEIKKKENSEGRGVKGGEEKGEKRKRKRKEYIFFL